MPSTNASPTENAARKEVMQSTHRFHLPDVGEGLTEAEIARWCVEVGDAVAVDEPLVEIETVKATVELPSPRAGVIVEIHAAVGEVLPVGALLVSISGDTRPDEEDASTAPPQFQPLVGYGPRTNTPRSEEHTSELQSRENLVCRLLLEKKNKK